MILTFTARFKKAHLFSAAFIILFSVNQVYSQNAPIRPEIADSTQIIGQSFTIDVRVGSEENGVENLFGVSFILRFNPEQHLSIASAAQGNFLGDDVVFFSFEDSPASIAIANTRKAGQGGVSGNGVVASVTFASSTDTPDCTPATFEIDSIKAIDVNGNPVAFAPQILVIGLQPEPDFSISAAPETLRVVAGASGNFMVDLTANCAFTDAAPLSANFPFEAVESVRFSPTAISSDESSTGTIMTRPAATPGFYSIFIETNGRKESQRDTVALEILPQPDFTLSAAPDSRTITAGQSAAYQISLTSIGSFNENVNLSVQGLPQNASAAFGSETLTPPDSAMLSIMTNPETSAGSYALLISGTSGAIVRSDTVALNVEAVILPGFELLVSPLEQTIRAGETANYEVSIEPEQGFIDSVALEIVGVDLSALGAPQLFPSIIRTDETAQLSISTSLQTNPAAYQFDVVANGGGITRDTTATLIVEAPEPETGVRPNPFTPNGDGFNDDVRFNIPGLIDNGGEVMIHNFRGKRVRRMLAQNSWNGRDDDGKDLPPGVYLYFVKINNEIAAKGSLTLIR